MELQYVQLPVIRTEKEGGTIYFIVNYQRQEYIVKGFRFQAQTETPDTIECFIEKDEDDDKICLKQSYRPLTRLFYSPGAVIEVCILCQREDKNGKFYYLVEDNNGLCYRLYRCPKREFYSHQRILCRVEALLPTGSPLLSYINNEKRSDGTGKYYSLKSIRQQIAAISERTWETLLQYIRTRSSKDEQARKVDLQLLYKENELPISLCEYLETLVLSGRELPNVQDELIHFEYHLGLFLLEDSRYLDLFSPGEAKHYRARIEQFVSQSEIRIKAHSMVSEGKAKEYIDTILRKLGASGYLRNRKERLTLLRELLMSDARLLKEYISQIVQAIKEMGKQHQSGQSEVLEFFPALDLYLQICPNDIQRNIEILSTQLLILAEKTDSGPTESYVHLKRSQLYRYLVYVGKKHHAKLLSMAMDSILCIGHKRMWYTWANTDQGQHFLLLQKALADNSQSPPFLEERIYENGARISVVNGLIRLLPIVDLNLVKLKQCVPEGILTSDRVKIYVPKQLPYPKCGTDLNELKKWWKKIESELFRPSIPERSKIVKHLPEIGDRIRIEVVGQRSENLFDCLICDPYYKGRGHISISEIISFNVHASMKLFSDRETGNYQFEAEVLSNENEQDLEFTMKTLIQQTIYENRNQITGDDSEDTCLIKSYDSVKGVYATVSSFGYSVFCPSERIYPVGTYIRARAKSILPNGFITAEVLGKDFSANFTDEDAAETLIFNYKESEKYVDTTHSDEEDEECRQNDFLDKQTIYEMMSILETAAESAADYIVSYNQLSYARLMACIIDDNKKKNYYSYELELIYFSQQFVINGVLGKKTFDAFVEENGKAIAHYPNLNKRMKSLQIVSMKDVSCNDRLLDIIKNSNNSDLSNLASLMLSYNLLSGFDLSSTHETLIKCMAQFFSIDTHEEEAFSFGYETLKVEFKSSAFYPAGSMVKNKEGQMQLICRVICGFLNSEGGVLYIGVNDTGTACGLDSDLAEYKGVVDKYTNYIRMYIKAQLGADINGQLHDYVKNYHSRLVYEIHIPAYHEPVWFKGKCWQRQGTSTIALDESSALLFAARRKQEEETIRMNAVAESLSLPPHTPVIEENDTKNVPVEIKSAKVETVPILTSSLRPNPVFDYDEGYEEDLYRFIHFLNNGEYMVTDKQSYSADVKLSLSIKEHEKKDFLLMVFEDGNISKVKVRNFAERDDSYHYKRCTDNHDSLFFATIANQDQVLLSLLEKDGKQYLRMDNLKDIKEEQDLKARGEKTCGVSEYKVVACEVITSEKANELDKLYSTIWTRIGINAQSQYVKANIELLQQCGICLN